MGAAEEEYSRWRKGRDGEEGGSAWGLKMNSETAGVFAHLFSCSCLVGERQRERETAEAKMERRRDGERWRDRHDGVTDRETVRRGEEKWERQNGVYSFNMSELVCGMKQKKEKKIVNQFPPCWHTRTNTLHGALQSALCMKHGVTHEVSVLSAASVAGAQMAMAILAAAPPSSCLMGEVVCDDVLLTVRGSSGNTWHRVCVSVCMCLCGEGHLRCEGWIFVRCVWKGQVWALTAAATSLKPRGGSSGETRDPQQSSVKAAGESCQCRRLNLYRPSLCLTLTLASLWLIVSALQTLSILSCLKRDAESKGKNESIFGCCKQKKQQQQKNFFPRLLSACQVKLPLCSSRAREKEFFCPIFLNYWPLRLLTDKNKLKEVEIMKARWEQGKDSDPGILKLTWAAPALFLLLYSEWW